MPSSAAAVRGGRSQAWRSPPGLSERSRMRSERAAELDGIAKICPRSMIPGSQDSDAMGRSGPPTVAVLEWGTQILVVDREQRVGPRAVREVQALEEQRVPAANRARAKRVSHAHAHGERGSELVAEPRD